MFTMGPVHTRDHGRRCFGAEPKFAARRMSRGKGHIYMPWEGGSNWDASTPSGIPGDP